MKIITTAFFLLYGTGVLASSVNANCHGGGASEDRFVYDVTFNSNIFDDSVAFDLEADGRGPGLRRDRGNRFDNIQLSAQMIRDHRGRPLNVQISGGMPPHDREIELSLDLSQPKNFAELELMRKDSLFIYGYLSCEIKLPEECRIFRDCRRRCHPMVGCEYICEED